MKGDENMNDVDIEKRLNELKYCHRVTIITDDRMCRNVYFSSIVNDKKNQRLIFDIHPPVSYEYCRILDIQQNL